MRESRKPTAPARRMATYRSRMRAAGLRPIQIWVPDSRSAAFAEKCRAQSLAIGKEDPAGAEIQDWIDAVYEWPKE